MFTYNTNLEPIKLKAYGRHLQSLLEKIKEIPDKEERTKYISHIMKLMKKIDGSSDNKTEQNLQVWHDLLVIADYNLDINTPYPIPEKQEKKQPDRLTYTKPMKEFRGSGRYLIAFIKAIGETIGKDSTEDEKILPALIKLVHAFHKKEDPTSLLHYIEEIIGKKITITPNLEAFLSKRIPEKRKNYNNSKNTRRSQ